MGDDDIQYFGNIRAFYSGYIQYEGKCNCTTADEISLECGCMLMILFFIYSLFTCHNSHLLETVRWLF